MKILALLLIFAAPIVFAANEKKPAIVTNSAAFNSLVQQQVKDQKALLLSLREDTQAVDGADNTLALEEKSADPEVIVLGASLDLIASDSSDAIESIVFTEKEHALLEKPIVAEEKQFMQLGEELSQAK